jgi:hypothetical protein
LSRLTIGDDCDERLDDIAGLLDNIVIRDAELRVRQEFDAISKTFRGVVVVVVVAIIIIIIKARLLFLFQLKYLFTFITYE